VAPAPSKPPQVIRSDNQKNAVLGVKVFLDLHKSFRASFEPQFMAFVEFVGAALKGFPEPFAAAFEGPGAAPPSDWSPSTRSFKVLAELPLTSEWLVCRSVGGGW
jgi:hypothetical protein